MYVRSSHRHQLSLFIGDGLHHLIGEHVWRKTRYLVERKPHGHVQLRRIHHVGEMLLQNGLGVFVRQQLLQGAVGAELYECVLIRIWLHQYIFRQCECLT